MGMLDGKVAIVTGAARGIGAAIAELFLAEGARVALSDINSGGAETVGRSHPGRHFFQAHDVSVPNQWTEMVDRCIEKLGRPDILVNNAGILQRGTLEDIDEATLERVLRVNQFGTFYGMKAVLPAMKEARTGSIINISSLGSLGGYPNIFAYGTSKWGIRGMTKSAARDLSKYGIRFNNILPGFIDTEISADVSAEVKATRAGGIPMGRLGTPEDVAGAALFLACDLSNYVTGIDLVVDGGMGA
jgi:3alpha(or 20beta)-hydroxysteroid dehydrogenase